MFKLSWLFVVLLLVACSERNGLAPVEEHQWRPQNPHQVTHKVRRGETLYAIAFRYDKDYRELAAFNHLGKSYTVKVGQVLRLQSYRYASKPSYPNHTPYPKHPKRSKPNMTWNAFSYRGNWRWPAQGKVVANFYPQQGKKGIDIAGKKGASVYAAADGLIAYAGSGLGGYGNLIIIKHNDGFLTAYGNNNSNRVKEGQKVEAGQIIADMGVIDRRFWGVHFEIRKAGQPVNPLHYLRTG